MKRCGIRFNRGTKKSGRWGLTWAGLTPFALSLHQGWIVEPAADVRARDRVAMARLPDFRLTRVSSCVNLHMYMLICEINPICD